MLERQHRAHPLDSLTQAVGVDELIASRLVKRPSRPVKVLSNGELDRALTVHAHKFTAAARQKIEAAGGRAVQIGGDAADPAAE